MVDSTPSPRCYGAIAVQLSLRLTPKLFPRLQSLTLVRKYVVPWAWVGESNVTVNPKLASLSADILPLAMGPGPGRVNL